MWVSLLLVNKCKVMRDDTFMMAELYTSDISIVVEYAQDCFETHVFMCSIIDKDYINYG
jgi:hypothetical protein